jgi:hypothetical protein
MEATNGSAWHSQGNSKIQGRFKDRKHRSIKAIGVGLKRWPHPRRACKRPNPAGCLGRLCSASNNGSWAYESTEPWRWFTALCRSLSQNNQRHIPSWSRVGVEKGAMRSDCQQGWKLAVVACGGWRASGGSCYFWSAMRESGGSGASGRWQSRDTAEGRGWLGVARAQGRWHAQAKAGA